MNDVYIVGTVEAIFFQNTANFYKVILVNIEETDSGYEDTEVVVTGTIGDITEGESYRFNGVLKQHPKYGEQLQLTSYEKVSPATGEGLIKYLSSEKFPGIGLKTATRIIEIFGENAIDEILAHPNRLNEISSLNQTKRDTILNSLRANYGMEKALLGLAKYGLGNHLNFQIYQLYKDEAIQAIEENPYQLVETIKGIGFKRADHIAEQIGIDQNSNERFRAAVIHEVLQSAITTGDTYIEAKDLLELAITTLEESRPYPVDPQKVAQALLELVEEGKVQQDGTKIFENSLYFAENGIVAQIKRLLKRKQLIQYDEQSIEEAIGKVEKSNRISYGSLQRQAIIQAIQSSFFILTGGPGTGKTTIVNGILQVFAQLNNLSLLESDYHDQIYPFLLAAPTGRAAKRMNETTGLPASTIHRKLGLTADDDNEAEANDLSGNLLIVDEFSMVDTWLANQLFQAIPQNMQIIFVGDKDQLPSVGPGQIFADLLQISAIPKIELEQIYRQGANSSVISLAHSIKNGQLPSDFTTNQADKSFFPANSQIVVPLIEKILVKAKAKGISVNEIQILAPMYRGSAGINRLNQVIQDIFNPLNDGMIEVTFNDLKFRRNDKILHLVNEPEHNVFNGDIGYISSIIPAKHAESKMDELVLDFDGNEVIYPRNQWHKITLSYAMSIHKAQGSEFELIILPLVNAYHRMLQRNLLYTAITRSRSKLILIGEVSAFEQAIHHQGNTRKTNLLACFETDEISESPIADNADLASSPSSEDYILTTECINNCQISPNIGLGDLTPYSFMEKTN